MKRYLSNIFSSAVYRVKRFAPRPDKGLRILTYHRINNLVGDRLSVRPEEFENQMRWLKSHGYTGVSVSAGLTSLRASEGSQAISIPCNDGQIPIAITFDDGYLDNYTNAFPILKKYRFSATVYLIAGFVGTNKTMPRSAGKSERAFLDWEEIREMAQEKMEFGSHTMTHPRLTTVDRETAESELIRSKEVIEKRLGSSCGSFCYPGGMWNKQLEALVRRAGYQNASTVMPGANFAEDSLFRLRRTEISGEDSIFEFEKKLAGAYDLLHEAWQAAGMLKSRPGATFC